MKKLLIFVLFSIPAFGQAQSGVQFADRFAGADVCQRIERAMNALPLTGSTIPFGEYAGQPARAGVVDARNFRSGIQPCAAGLNIKYSVELLLGNYELRVARPIDIRQGGVTIRGVGWEHNQWIFAARHYVQPQPPNEKTKEAYHNHDRSSPRFSMREPAFGTAIRAAPGFVGNGVIRIAPINGRTVTNGRGDDVTGALVDNLQVNCAGQNINGVNIGTANQNHFVDNEPNPASAWAVFGTITRISVYGCQDGIRARGPLTFNWTISESHIGQNQIGVHLMAYSNAYRLIGDEITDNQVDGIFLDSGTHNPNGNNAPPVGTYSFGVQNVSVFGGDLEANNENNIHATCLGGHVDGVAVHGVYMETGYGPGGNDVSAADDFRFDNCNPTVGTAYRGWSIAGNYMMGGSANQGANYSIKFPTETALRVVGFDFSGNLCQNYQIACIYNTYWAAGTIGANQTGPRLGDIVQPNKFGLAILDPYSNGASQFTQPVQFTDHVTFGGLGSKTTNFNVPTYFNSSLTLNSIINAGFGVTDANLPVYINPNMALNLRFLDSTAATSSQNHSSPRLQTMGEFWNGSASQKDVWQFAPMLNSGGTPATSTLNLVHSGVPKAQTTINMTDASLVNLPNIKVTEQVDATAVNVFDKGTCRMASGTCNPPIAIGPYPSAQGGPHCVGNWTGIGKLDGNLKMVVSPDGAHVTPCSSDLTDDAQVTWVCFGKK